jgi:CBS domain-containing protein
MVCLREVRKLDRAAWDRTAVRDIMISADKLAFASPHEDAGEVLSRLASKDLNQLPVVENGRVRGLVRREDILKWLALYADLGLES